MSFYCEKLKSSINEGFHNCVGQKWTHDDFSDFTVVVEDQEFHCHKFILSACSKFFDGLLRTEMKDNLENRAVLKTMSKETFDVIINAVYKGENGLTEENITLVWHATCFLNIPFLLEICEDFVSENMSLTNFESYYESAIMLESKPIVKCSHAFMIANFSKIKDTETFHTLSVDDLCNMIDSDKLLVNSEDVVIQSILQWIKYRTNDDDVLKGERTDCVSTTKKSSEQNNDGYNVTVTKEETNDCDSVKVLNDEHKSKVKNDTDENAHNESSVFRTSDTISTAVSSSIKEKTKRRKKKMVKDVENPKSKDLGQPNQTKAVLNSQQSISTLTKQREIHLDEECSRVNHIVKLLRSARMFLVSRGCLENLTRNSVITSNPEALNLVYEALMYKYKAVNYRNIIVRYRECSEIINGVAFFSNEDIVFHDLINDRMLILFDKASKTDQYPAFVALAAIDSVVCYSTLRTERVTTNSYNRVSEKTYTYVNLLNVQKGAFSELGKFKGSNKAFFLNYNNSFVKVDYSDTGLKVFQRNCQISFGLSLCVAGAVVPTHAAVFEDDILIFYSARSKTGAKKCSPGNNSMFNLQEIEGPAENMTSFQSGKYLYLLQNNGSVWLVTRSNSDDIEFTHLATLWHFELKLNGAVCYNKILYVYAEIVEIDQVRKIIYITELQKKSLPDVFDSIKVVHKKCQSQIVPLQIPLSSLFKLSRHYNFA